MVYPLAAIALNCVSSVFRLRLPELAFYRRILATLILAMIGQSWSLPAHAFTGCDLQAVGGVTTASGISGSTQTINFEIVDMGGCPPTAGTVSVTVISDGTSGATLLSSSNVTLGPGIFPVTVKLGNGDGSVETKINCSLCISNSLSFFFSTSNSYQLTKTTSSSVSVEDGTPVTLGYRATRNGSEPVSANVFFDVSPADFTLGDPVNGLPTSAANGDGSVTFTRVPSVTTTYSITPKYCNPTSSCTGYVSTATPFQVTINRITRTLAGGGNFQGSANRSLLLTVRADDNGAPKSGETIQWQATGPATLSSTSGVTDGNGEASVTVTLANSVGSTATVTASRQDDASQTANFTLVIVPPHINQIAGNQQSGGISGVAPVQLEIELLDGTSSNVPLASEPITWTVLSGPAQLDSNTSTTDANGKARIGFNFGNTPGDSIIEARDSTGLASATFTATTLAPELDIFSGDGQSGFTGQVLSHPLIVAASSGGIADVGIPINWSINSGDATLSANSSITDSNGLAEINVTLGSTPGPITVSATRADGNTAAVSFSLTAQALPSNQLMAVSGSGQSGIQGSSADAPLVVLLQDGFGKAIGSASISWTVASGSIQLSAANSLTDSSGQASINFAYGTTAGSATVRASDTVSGTFVDFPLEVLGGAVQPAAGNGQTGEVSKPLPQPLTVRIGNAGTPALTALLTPQGLAGVPVSWAVTAGGGSVSASNTVTDANGESSVVFTLGPNAGAHSVTATTPAGTTVFTATAVVPDTTGALTKISGDNQTLPTGTESAPLVVELRNASGAPIPGVSITWSATNATLTAASSITDSDGRAQIIAKVDLPGAATVSASSTSPDADPVSFSINGGVANLPQLTPIQQQVAGVIDELCPALAALPNRTAAQDDLLLRCRELADASGLDPEATIGALDQLFAELAAAEANASIIALQSQFQNLKSRIAALRSGSAGSGMGGLSFAGPGGLISLGNLFTSLAGDEAPEVGAEFSRWGWFVSGTIGRGESDPTSLSPAYDYDINGLTAGIDYRYNDRLVIGGSLGYTRQDTDASDKSGSLDTEGFSISAYGTWFQQNNWYFDGVLTFGRNTYDSLRKIQYELPRPGGGSIAIDQVAKAHSSGDVLQGAFTFGRDFQKKAWNYGAYGRLLYSRAEFGEAEETLLPGAGNGLGLALEARNTTSLATVLGGKASYARSVSWGVLMPHVELEWERETRDDPQIVDARFLNDPTAGAITIAGDPVDQSYFRFGLGLSMVLAQGRSGFFYYERLMGRTGQTQENLSLGFRMEF